MELTTKLYPYQEQGVASIHSFGGRALLADDMGLGKCIQSIAYAFRYDALPLLVICPASLKWNWQNELLKHAGLEARVLSSQSPPNGIKKMLRYQAWIINYDILVYWEDILSQLPIELLVLDESHYLADPGAKRTKAVRRLSRNIPRIIAATGTPISNRPADLWPTLNILLPSEFPSFRPFGIRYCAPKRTQWGIQYRGATRLEELNRRLLDSCMIRRRKQDVLTQLPAKARHVVTVDVANMDEYRRASGELFAWLGQEDRRKDVGLEKIGKLRMLVGRLKIQGVFDFIDAFLAGGEKLIVYGCHYHVIGRLEARYKKQCSVVTGRVVKEARQIEFDRFNKDEKCRLFIGNVRAAGVGWNCTSADTVCFAELDWSPGVLAQAEDRIHGVGRGTGGPSAAYYLTAKGTIEEMLFRVIQKKSEHIAKAIDGGDSDMEIYDMLLEEIQKEQSNE